MPVTKASMSISGLPDISPPSALSRVTSADSVYHIGNTDKLDEKYDECDRQESDAPPGDCDELRFMNTNTAEGKSTTPGHRDGRKSSPRTLRSYH